MIREGSAHSASSPAPQEHRKADQDRGEEGGGIHHPVENRERHPVFGISCGATRILLERVRVRRRTRRIGERERTLTVKRRRKFVGGRGRGGLCRGPLPSMRAAARLSPALLILRRPCCAAWKQRRHDSGRQGLHAATYSAGVLLWPEGQRTRPACPMPPEPDA